jgi:hypothetical protein
MNKDRRELKGKEETAKGGMTEKAGGAEKAAKGAKTDKAGGAEKVAKGGKTEKTAKDVAGGMASAEKGKKL